MKYRLSLKAAIICWELAIIGLCRLSPADTENWKAADGNWDTAANWSSSEDFSTSGAVPGIGGSDDANIIDVDSTTRIITLNVTVALDDVTIFNLGSGTNTLSQTGNFNLSANSENLGGTNDVGAHGAHIQSAGTNTYSGTLSIGDGTGSLASYDLSGGTISVQGIDALYIGNYGSGTLTQSGSSNVSMNSLMSNSAGMYIGAEKGSRGTYDMSGGRFTEVGTFTVGYGGDGTLNQSAGAITIGNSNTVSNLGIAGNGGTGTLDLSGTGSLSVFGNVNVGADGVGTLKISGGSMSVVDALNLNTGTLNLSAGMLIVNNGIRSFGAINQSGGTMSASKAVAVFGGMLSQSAGVSTLSNNSEVDLENNGTLKVSATARMHIDGDTYIGGNSSGKSGVGTLTLTGGSLSVSGELEIYSGSSATISGGSIGIGNGIRTYGSITQSGGTLSAAGDFAMFGASLGQSAGAATFAANSEMDVENSATLSVSGTARMYVGGDTYIGGNSYESSGVATLAISGGSLNVTGGLTAYSGSPIIVSGGSLSVGDLRPLGSYTQTAGTVNASQFNVSGSTAFTFGGGTLIVGSGGFQTPGAGVMVGDGVHAALMQLQNAPVSNGALTVASNGTLTGGGNVSVPTTVKAGGALASHGYGDLTFGSNVILNRGAILQFQIGDPSEPGTTFDQATITGGTFMVGGSTLQLIPMAGLALNTPYPIVATGGSGTIDSSTPFANLANGTDYNSGLAYTVSYSSSEIDVTFTSVPEPVAIFPVLSSAILLLTRFRRV